MSGASEGEYGEEKPWDDFFMAVILRKKKKPGHPKGRRAFRQGNRSN